MTAMLILAALTLAYAVEQRRLRGAADREAARLRGEVARLGSVVADLKTRGNRAMLWKD